MYVRFNAIYKTDAKEIHGVFSVVGCLFKNTTAKTNLGTSEDERRIWELNNWFRYNLELPDKVNRGNNQNEAPTGVSWFKDTAHEHIKNLREISSIIQKHGALVELLQTDNPGYILYEDEFQVFAEALED